MAAPRIASQVSGREPAAEPSASAPLIYVAVGIGLTISLTALLIGRGSFGIGTAVLALLLVAPYLLYARLALARPGAEAVLGGVLLLAVGTWGSITAAGDDGAGSWIRLPLELVALELAVFAAGALLRSAVPARRGAADGDETD